MTSLLELFNGKGFAVLITGKRLAGKTTLAERLYDDLCRDTSAPIILVTGDELRSPIPMSSKRHRGIELTVGGEPMTIKTNADRGKERLRKVLAPIAVFVENGGIAVLDVYFPTIRQRRVFQELFSRHLSIHLAQNRGIWRERRLGNESKETSVLNPEKEKGIGQEWEKMTSEYEEPLHSSEYETRPRLVIDCSHLLTVTEESAEIIKTLVSDNCCFLQRKKVDQNAGCEQGTDKRVGEVTSPEVITTASDVYSLLRANKLERVELVKSKGWVIIEESSFAGLSIKVLIDLVPHEAHGLTFCHIRSYLPLYPSRSEMRGENFLAWLLDCNNKGPLVPYFALDNDGQLLWCFTFPMPSSGFNREEFMKGFSAPLKELRALLPKLMMRMYGGMLPDANEALGEMISTQKELQIAYAKTLQLKQLLENISEDDQQRIFGELAELSATKSPHSEGK